MIPNKIYDAVQALVNAEHEGTLDPKSLEKARAWDDANLAALSLCSKEYTRPTLIRVYCPALGENVSVVWEYTRGLFRVYPSE